MDQLAPNSAMIAIRAEIDALDNELAAMLAARQRLIERAIAAKIQEKLPARIPSRIDEVVTRAQGYAHAHNLDPDLAKTIWTHMVEWFVQFEQRQLGR